MSTHFKWTANGLEAKFKAALANALTNFCVGNFSICGFNSSDIGNFTSSSIRFSPGYPANADSHYLTLRLSIAYNLELSGEPDRKFTLPELVTTTILESNRMNIHEAVGHYIVYIDSRFYSIPPPHFINMVVVSATGGFTLLLIITALTMRKCIPDNPRTLHKKSSHKKLSLGNGRSIAGLTTETVAAAAAAATVAAAVASSMEMARAECAEPDASELLANGALNPGFRNSLADCAVEQIGLSEAGSANGEVAKDNNNEGEDNGDK